MEITNDFKLDRIKDKFTPPKDGHVDEEILQELFERLNLNLDYFKNYVYSNSEYYTDNGKNMYSVRDVSRIIRHLFNIESLPPSVVIKKRTKQNEENRENGTRGTYDMELQYPRR